MRSSVKSPPRYTQLVCEKTDAVCALDGAIINDNRRISATRRLNSAKKKADKAKSGSKTRRKYQGKALRYMKEAQNHQKNFNFWLSHYNKIKKKGTRRRTKGRRRTRRRSRR